MKLKSLLFGSAAILAAGTGAQAADLPTAEPVEYVRICDAFGTGFFYIPGTDTCLKIGGSVEASSAYIFGDNDDPDIAEFFGTDPAEFNNWSSRARVDVTFDARTQTQMGLVRSFIDLRLTLGAFNTGTDATEGTATASALHLAYVQLTNSFGTYTAGRANDFFDFWGSHGYETRLGINDQTTQTNLFAYTFAGGNGFSFTVAAEDPMTSNRRDNPLIDDYEGQEYPDGVANIRVDQGWGSAQIMGVVHSVHDIGVTGFPGDVDDTRLGWAVGAGLSLGIPGGWKLDSEAGYSEGAIKYITTDPLGFGDFAFDDLNKAWMVRAGVTGPLISPHLTVWADGSFTHIETGVDNDFSYDFWAALVGAAYEVAPGLTMGPEVVYNRVETGSDVPGFVADDADVWGAEWHVTRKF